MYCFFSYHFVKVWNSYQLLQQVNQPLSLQNNCTAMLDNHTKVMVETDHTSKLICIFYSAILFGITLELHQIYVKNLFGSQGFNHLFKQKPPKRDKRKLIRLHDKPLFLLFTLKIAILSTNEQVLMPSSPCHIIIMFSRLSFQIANNKSARTIQADLSRSYLYSNNRHVSPTVHTTGLKI